MGFSTTPVIPEAIPVKVLFNPKPIPSSAFLGLSTFSSSL
jgi:hypothetical protein